MRHILPLLLLTACFGGEPVTVDEAVDAYIDESGLTFARCGELTVDETCPTSPDPDQDAVVACLLAAWETCEPVRADEVWIHGGVPFEKALLVVPEDSGCVLMRFAHSTITGEEDTVLQEACTEVYADDTCPWYVADDCFTACGDDDVDCG